MHKVKSKLFIHRLIKPLITILVAACLTGEFAYANPVLEGVESGNVNIQQTPGNTQVNQSSQQAIINWNSFNIDAGEKTHFEQPVNGVALNRINPQQGASQIFGQLSSTGRIILVNQAGIFFGPGAQVDVQGIIATTANISSENFLANKYIFDQPSSYVNSSIINQGSIVAANNGLVAFIGTNISNEGVIQAKLGNVVLASGNKFTIDLYGDQLISFTVDEATSALNSSVSNSGKIVANGGTILLTAKVAKKVIDNVINMSGVLEANSIQNRNGQIILASDGDGIVKVSGKIKAAGYKHGKKGGEVAITGQYILLNSGSVIDTSGDAGGGNIYIGGNYQGKGPLMNATATVVSDNTKLLANAMTTGNGGTIIVWANNVTKVYGALSATGGSISGNGGFIETSGKNFLDVNGATVNTLAPYGKTGLWLLDPSNIYIAIDQASATSAGMNGSDSSASTGDGGNPDIFAATTNTDDSLLTISSLTAALSTTDVTVTTSNSNGTGVGNITVVDPFTWTSGQSLILSADNDININAKIIWNGSLSLVATNDVNINSSLGNLTTTPGGSLTVTAGNTINVGIAGTGLIDIQASLGQQYNSPIVLYQDATFSAGDAGSGTGIYFNTIDDSVAGSHNLIVNNDQITEFGANVGGTTSLASLVVQGLVSQQIGATSNDYIQVSTGGQPISINTTGDQTYRGVVYTDANSVNFSSNTGQINFDNDPTLSSNLSHASIETLPGGSTTSADVTISTAGNVSFRGSVGTSTGGGTGLMSLTINANNTTFNSSNDLVSGYQVFSNNSEYFNTAVTLGGDTTFSADNSSLEFVSTVNGGYALNIAGTTSTINFDDIVGGVTPLASLNISSGTTTLNTTAVTTSGDQTYLPLLLNSAGSVGVTLTSTAGDISFDTVDTNSSTAPYQPLTVYANAGTVTFNNRLSLSFPTDSILGEVNINADHIVISNNADILFAQQIELAAATDITLNINTILQTNGNILVSGDVIGSDKTLELYSSYGLAQISLGNYGTSSTPMGTLKVDFGELQLGGNIYTTGDVNLSGVSSVALANDILINSTASSTSGDISMPSATIDGAHDLTISTSGNVLVGGSIGSNTPLNNLTINDAQTTLQGTDIQTTGDINLNGTSVILGNNLTISSAASLTSGAISILGTIDGAYDLIISTSGNTLLGQAIGSSTPLTSLSVTSNQTTLQGGAVSTSGDQTYNGTLILTNSTNFAENNLIFNNDIDAAGLDIVAVGVGNFTFAGAISASTVSLTGSSGSTLTIPIGDKTWNIDQIAGNSITGLAAGTQYSNITTSFLFSSIDNLVGGVGNDTFAFKNGSAINSIDGGVSGVDTLDYSSYGSAIAVNLQAATATAINGTYNNINAIIGDSTAFGALTGFDVDSAWVLSGVHDGTVTGLANGFSNINNLVGGAGINTLTASNTANSWNISGSNSGDVTGTSFSNMQNLIGNNSDDSFVFLAAGSISTIDGGSGGINTLDYSNYGSAINVDLQNISAPGVTGTFSNINAVIGDSSSFGTLTGLNSNSTWTLSGTNAGSVTGLANGFSNIDTLVGGSGINTLVGDNTANTWNITNQNQGTVSSLTGSFSNMQNLTGGSGDDTFIFINGGVDGVIEGGISGTDTIDFSTQSSIINLTLTGVGTDHGFAGSYGGNFDNIDVVNGSSSFANTIIGPNVDTDWYVSGTDNGSIVVGANSLSYSAFQNLQGGSSGINTLIGDNVANTWTIYSSNQGIVTGVSGGFTNMQNLKGGTANDEFIFATDGLLINAIDGGAGGTDTMDISVATSAANVSLTSAGTQHGLAGSSDTGASTFNNIDVLNGPLSSTNTLTGPNTTTTWSVSGADIGSVVLGANSLQYNTFQNLVGGSGNDSFVLSGGTVSGSIDGGGGSNTMIGDDVANTWTITGSNQGAVNGVSGGFSNMQNLKGGAANDEFIFATDGLLVSAVDGGAGGTDTMDISAATSAANVSIASAGASHGLAGSADTGASSFNNIDILNGPLSSINTLTGPNVSTTWLGLGADVGSVIVGGNSMNYNTFQNLVGGSGDDSFTLNGGTVSGSINGGSGTNSITANNVANTWIISSANAGTVLGIAGGFSSIQTLIGGDDTDNFILNGGTLSGGINGGAGINSLTAGNVANTWEVTGHDSGTVTGVAGGFSHVQNLTGGAQSNLFTFSNGATLSGVLNGGDSGLNTLDFKTQYSTSISVVFSGDGVGAVNDSGNNALVNFSKINQIDSSGESSMTLPNKPNNYIEITQYSAGLLNDPVGFSGFNTFINSSSNGIAQFSVPVISVSSNNVVTMPQGQLTFFGFSQVIANNIIPPTPPTPVTPTVVTTTNINLSAYNTVIGAVTGNNAYLANSSNDPTYGGFASLVLPVAAAIDANIYTMAEQQTQLDNLVSSNLQVNLSCGQ